MQLLNNLSKIIILVVALSCSMFFALNPTNFTVTAFTSTNNATANINDGVISQSSAAQSQSIWNSMRSDLTLDHAVQSSQVQAQIRKLVANQADFYRTLQAAGPYIYYIYQQTRSRGLPAEIALIPIIESEFNPNDHSVKGAAGLWQLMPETAHELGVKVKSGYDGRKNVIDSTQAALSYFKDLGNSFNGDWYLAIAAYNCGQDRIQVAEHKTGSQTFWDLPLPQETKLYVPKLLAVAAILKDPQKYGMQLPPISDKPYFTTLQTTKSVNLNTVAKQSGINIKTLTALNPDYKHAPLPTKQGAYTLLVPVSKAPIVKAQLASKIIPNTPTTINSKNA